MLILLALLTEFKTETFAALLGTVAGYVLSNTEDKTSNSTSSNSSNSGSSKS